MMRVEMLDRLVIGTLAVLLVVVVAFGLFYLRNVSSGDFSGHDQPGQVELYDDWPKRYARLGYPAVNAEGAERVQDWQEIAHDTCAAQSVDLLAWILNDLNTDDTGAPVGPRTTATRYAVATAYARWASEPTVYEACLQGFRDKR
jgi:hypothetical protein